MYCASHLDTTSEKNLYQVAYPNMAENNGFVWQSTLQNEFTPTNEMPLDMELYELYNEK